MAAELRITTFTIFLMVVGLLFFYRMYDGPLHTEPVYDHPQQPIDFFHRIHAGDKQIQCAFCHRTTATEAFAGMPSTETCMRCHRVVIPHHPEIDRLHQFWENQEAVPWVRVNHLPGFVYFTHKAHIAAGVKCTVCHGDLTKMDRVYQTAPLSMGWCLTCHRQNKAPEDCWTCHR